MKLRYSVYTLVISGTHLVSLGEVKVGLCIIGLGVHDTTIQQRLVCVFHARVVILICFEMLNTK